MMYNVSSLDHESVDALQALERETGRTLLAFSLLPVVSDDLSEAELAKIQALEQRLGVVLVAVRQRPPRTRGRRGDA